MKDYKYSEDEINDIAEGIIQLLLKKDDGFETSTAMMAHEMGHADINDSGLFQLHSRLFQLAEENGIVLDMSEHEGMLEGLPYNLTFIVRK